MTDIGGVRLRMAIVVGALAGVGAGLVFATAHAFIIVPIWDRMMGGLMWGALAGAIGGWTYCEWDVGNGKWGRVSLPLPTSHFPLWRQVLSGAVFGAVLWFLVAPVSAVDAALRWAGVLPRLELLGVGLALVIAAGTGSLFGWSRTGTRRGMIAGAIATLFLTFAMAGPVPIGRSPRAFGIFLSVLPAAMIAGAILGVMVHSTVRFRDGISQLRARGSIQRY
jgi:hypothetical protein